MVPENTWRDAPEDNIIIGLKELPVETCKLMMYKDAINTDISKVPLKHVHVQFAHCYKQQAGWEKVLARFARGNGVLLDLEFLTESSGRRVAVRYISFFSRFAWILNLKSCRHLGITPGSLGKSTSCPLSAVQGAVPCGIAPETVLQYPATSFKEYLLIIWIEQGSFGNRELVNASTTSQVSFSACYKCQETT